MEQILVLSRKEIVMKNLITLSEVATLTGYTVGTLHTYSAAGRFPPPLQRIGSAGLYSRADVRSFMRRPNTRPNALKSVRGV